MRAVVGVLLVLGLLLGGTQSAASAPDDQDSQSQDAGSVRMDVRAGFDGAGRDRRRVLQNWFSPRAARAERICAFIRAHDVSRFGERAEDAAHQADQFERRIAEWIEAL